MVRSNTAKRLTRPLNKDQPPLRERLKKKIRLRSLKLYHPGFAGQEEGDRRTPGRDTHFLPTEAGRRAGWGEFSAAAAPGCLPSRR